MAYRKKQYGDSKTEYCPFCGSTALTKNEQGVVVCLKHKNSSLQDMKCVCGTWLNIRPGKWGAYALCESCGPMNLKKAYEMNNGPREAKITSAKPEPKQYNFQEKPKSKKPREIVVRSDELDFL